MGFAMSGDLILLGIVIAASSGLTGLCFERTSTCGQWLTTALATIGAAIGLAGVAAFWVTSDSSPIVQAWAIPGGEFSIAVDGLSAAQNRRYDTQAVKIEPILLVFLNL
ncbi:MAG TPA: hypothetical protein VFE46_01510 [Pirellulales bacterium]|jgi:hypothetical protein|nr:hypothetical protein [Pirellulales bacterium]